MYLRYGDEGDLDLWMEARLSAYIYLSKNNEHRESAQTLMSIAKAKAFQNFCHQTGVTCDLENWATYGGACRG